MADPHAPPRTEKRRPLRRAAGKSIPVGRPFQADDGPEGPSYIPVGRPFQADDGPEGPSYGGKGPSAARLIGCLLYNLRRAPSGPKFRLFWQRQQLDPRLGVPDVDRFLPQQPAHFQEHFAEPV